MLEKWLKLVGKRKESTGEKAVSCYVQHGEKSLSTTLQQTSLPVLTVPAVIPLHMENIPLKELGLCDRAYNQ